MPLDTILLLDTSGSMAGRGIRELKRACNVFLDGVQETARQTGLRVCHVNLHCSIRNRTRRIYYLATELLGLLLSSIITNLSLFQMVSACVALALHMVTLEMQ